MSQIQYPTGTNRWTRASNLDNHAGRGSTLEEDINASNSYYKETDKALIYKKPTPVQVVKVDYPARGKAKITEAYYRTPSTTDYNGVYRGKYIDFEAKETKNKSGFPLYLVQTHQISHLEKVSLHGGIGFFIIRFKSMQDTRLVDASSLIRQMRQTTHSYVPYDWFVQNSIQIREGYAPRLAYLDAVDDLYFSKEDT